MRAGTKAGMKPLRKKINGRILCFGVLLVGKICWQPENLFVTKLSDCSLGNWVAKMYRNDMGNFDLCQK
jgi:hypothetical protein